MIVGLRLPKSNEFKQIGQSIILEAVWLDYLAVE
jgi:hypothetical protein